MSAHSGQLHLREVVRLRYSTISWFGGPAMSALSRKLNKHEVASQLYNTQLYSWWVDPTLSYLLTIFMVGWPY